MGNFPVRMLVILVKLSKLLELKRKIVKKLADLNAEAERTNLLSDSYHPTFQVIELLEKGEIIGKIFNEVLTTIRHL